MSAWGQLIQGMQEHCNPVTSDPSPGLGDTPRSVYTGGQVCKLVWPYWRSEAPEREAPPQDFALSGISPWSPEWLSELYFDLWAREGPSYKIIASNCNLEKL